MFKTFLKIFYPPVFEDEEKNSKSVYLNAILWTSLALITVLRITSLSYIKDVGTFFLDPITILIVVIGALIYVMHRGFVRAASTILLIATWAILSYQARSSSGVYDTAFIGNFVLIVMAGLLLGRWAGLFFALLATLTGWGLAYLQTTELLVATVDIPYNIARDETVVFILISLISFLTISGLQNALIRAGKNTEEMLKSNQQLQTLRADLEIRVEERTIELEKRSRDLAERTTQLEIVNIRTQKRAAQLQAIADVSRAIATVRKLNELLPRIALVVSEQFNFYHVGIFLLDEANQFAILSASNSDGGQRMMARSHRLKVGAQGLVGFATQSGKSRIALDTGADATYFNNPELPETRSEMAVPLISGGKVIGALDVQSNQSNAFIQEDIEMIQILADQISIAIDNARQFDQTQKSISEADTIYRQYVRREWERIGVTERILGYRHNLTGTQELEDRVSSIETRKVLDSGEILAENEGHGKEASLSVPIKLRDEVIGFLNIRSPQKRAWNKDEINLVKSVADRVAISAENARLFEETTDRAERERTVSQITSKIRSTNDPNQMIQIALEELKQALRIKDARIVPYVPPQSPDKG